MSLVILRTKTPSRNRTSRPPVSRRDGAVEPGTFATARLPRSAFRDREDPGFGAAPLPGHGLDLRSLDLVRPDRRETSIFYTVNLELVDVETNQKVWIGNKQIKKLIERRRTRL
jgi:hypothetical protein